MAAPTKSLSLLRGRRRRAPWYRYSRFWFSLAISSLLLSTAVMLLQAPRDPYDTVRMTSIDAFLRPIQPAQAKELDTISADLRGVAVSSDGKIVYVGGNSGLIASSTDGGVHWTKETIALSPSPPKTSQVSSKSSSRKKA